MCKTDQISQFGNSLIRPVQKNAFRFGCGLDSKVLSLQVIQAVDIAVLIYSVRKSWQTGWKHTEAAFPMNSWKKW